MNFTPFEILIFVACIGLACYLRGRAGLFFLWPIAVLVFPTARIHLGFPLYLYDIIVTLMLVAYWRELLALRWSSRLVPWHYVFFILVLVSGLFVPLIIYRPDVQIIWVTVHALLAFSSFGFGAMLCAGSRKLMERRLLGYGIAASTIILGAIGVFQFGSPQNAGAIANFFYGDFASTAFVQTQFYAEIAAERAAGPYGSANVLGVVGVLGVLLTMTLVRERIVVLATLAAGAIAVLSSVSRQAMIGAVIAAAIYFLLSRPRQRLSLSMLGVFVGPALVVAFLASDYSQSALERLGRWNVGLEKDSNFQARYVDGPERLWETIVAFPSVGIFGTGPDIVKLASNGVDTGGREYGFLSLAYLLFLFQYGIFGFIAVILMHLQAWFQLRFVNARARATVGALLAAMCTFYFADNAPAISESVSTLCLLAVGIVCGCAMQAAGKRGVPGARRAGNPPAALA